MTVTENLTGLSSAEAAKRLLIQGANELPSQKRPGILRQFISVIADPMLFLLIACGAIYLAIGEPKDAWMLIAFVGVVIGITFYQERKTERAVAALKNIASPIARVIRDGKEIKIPSRDLVTDDIIEIREGDRIPADGMVVKTSNLLVDEAVLTGESVSVRKTVWNGFTKRIRPGGEDLPFVYSGTLVTQGRARVKVLDTGVHTEIGKIGRSLATIKDEETLLKRETNLIVRNFATGGIAVCVLVVLVYGYLHGNWLQGILAGLTLSMALLPEEFSVVLVIFLTLGAWRMSKHKVLVRKTPAIESLGAATVLCVDKTGTLTENNMELDGLWINNKTYSVGKFLPDQCHTLLEYAALASQRDPYDAVEKEIIATANTYVKDHVTKYDSWTVVREYPFSGDLFSVSHVWKSPDSNDFIVAAKGSPEAIADLCHFSKKQLDEMEKTIGILAGQGYRILGVAGTRFTKKDTATKQHDYPFVFAGLLLFADPVRASSKQAVAECYRAGVRVMMITGDYAGTAQSVAREIGLTNADKYLTGADIAGMTKTELQEKVKTINIFARMVPEQKLALVDALKANGEIVAMTGDGVNDAPALKSAHIGIAMGQRGTDVARETAELILLNDDFMSIVVADRMGRRIFDNLQKAMVYIVSVHIPVAGMSLLPLLFGMPIVLLPAHIAFLELIIDPACSIVFEAEEEDDDIMMRPPRNLQEPLLGKRALLTGLFQGIGVLVTVLSAFLITKSATIAFVTIVVANILLIMTNLSKKENIVTILIRKNTSLKWMLLFSASGLAAVLYLPFLREVFHFSVLSPQEIAISFGMALVSLVWFKVLDRVIRA